MGVTCAVQEPRITIDFGAIRLGRVELSIRGTFLEDHDETMLVRPEAGSDVEIPKTNVLAIEETRRLTKPMIRFL